MLCRVRTSLSLQVWTSRRKCKCLGSLLFPRHASCAELSARRFQEVPQSLESPVALQQRCKGDRVARSLDGWACMERAAAAGAAVVVAHYITYATSSTESLICHEIRSSLASSTERASGEEESKEREGRGARGRGAPLRQMDAAAVEVGRGRSVGRFVSRRGVQSAVWKQVLAAAAAVGSPISSRNNQFSPRALFSTSSK